MLSFVSQIVVLAWIAIFTVLGHIISKGKENGSIHTKKLYKRSVSSDGHVIPAEDDITCANIEDHYHAPNGYDRLPRYIAHEEPVLGYVILNGKKRRLTDCKHL